MICVQVAAAAGYTVIGADLNESVLASGKNAIESSVRKMAERKKKKDASFDAAATSQRCNQDACVCAIARPVVCNAVPGATPAAEKKIAYVFSRMLSTFGHAGRQRRDARATLVRGFDRRVGGLRPHRRGHRGERRREVPFLRVSRANGKAGGHIRLQHLLATQGRARKSVVALESVVVETRPLECPTVYFAHPKFARSQNTLESLNRPFLRSGFFGGHTINKFVWTAMKIIASLQVSRVSRKAGGARFQHVRRLRITPMAEASGRAARSRRESQVMFSHQKGWYRSRRAREASRSRSAAAAAAAAAPRANWDLSLSPFSKKYRVSRHALFFEFSSHCAYVIQPRFSAHRTASSGCTTSIRCN